MKRNVWSLYTSINIEIDMWRCAEQRNTFKLGEILEKLGKMRDLPSKQQ